MFKVILESFGVLFLKITCNSKHGDHRMKRIEIWDSGVLVSHVCISSFWVHSGHLFLRLGPNVVGNGEKMKKNSNILNISPRRAKLSENLDLGVSVEQIWGTFDLVVFKIILGSFCAVASIWHATRKQLAVE